MADSKDSQSNKKGRAVVIVLLVIALAIAGVIIYKNQAINTARADSMQQVEAIDVSLYDGDELSMVENYIADAKGKLESSKDVDVFNSIVEELSENIAQVKTTEQKQKEKEEAERKAAEEEARKQAKAEAAAAAAKASKKSSGSADSKGCVGGGSNNLY